MLGMLKEQAAAQRDGYRTRQSAKRRCWIEQLLRCPPPLPYNMDWMGVDVHWFIPGHVECVPMAWAGVGEDGCCRCYPGSVFAPISINGDPIWAHWHGPFHRSARGYCFIFVLVDYVIPKQCRYAPFLQRVWHKHSFRSSFDWHPERDAD